MLTHGAGGTHAAWFQQVPTLAATGFRVITWDCRGFGNSTFTSGVHGSAAAVADMAAVLDATGTPGAHLVGQSMGGWWVTAFTVAQPARTHSLTLSNTVGGLWTTALLEYFRAWMTTAAANFGADSARRAPGHLPHLRGTRPRPRLPLPTAEHLPHAPDGRGRRCPARRRGRAQRPRRHRRSRPRDHKHRRRCSAAPGHRQRPTPRRRVHRRVAGAGHSTCLRSY